MRSINSNVSMYIDSLIKGTEYKLRGHSKEDKEKKALEVLRYFVTEYMKWTPEEAREHMTESVMNIFRLRDVIRYLEYPDDVRIPTEGKRISFTTIRYILHRAFPDEIGFSETDAVIELWNDIRTGRETKFMGNFFDGEEGEKRRFCLFGEFLRRYVSTDITGMYMAFSNSAKINRKMLEVKLGTIISGYYACPLDMLHDYLMHYGEENRFLYTIYSYGRIAKLEESEMRESA